MKAINKIVSKIKKNRLKKWVIYHGNENHLLQKKLSKRKQKMILTKGFNEAQWFIFGLEKKSRKERKEYLTQFDRWEMRKINGKYAIILDDKRLFELIFSKYTYVPKVLFYLKNGRLFDSDQIEISNNLFLETLKKGKLFFRVNLAGGGEGTHLFQYFDESILKDNKEKIQLGDILSLPDGTFSAFLGQLDYSSKIYPHSTNTIRIVTINDDSFEIVACVHRFGTNYSKFIDNVSSGGIFANIDLATGQLSYAYSEFVQQKYEQHPDTHEQIKGTIVPYWEKVKDQVLQLHRRVPYLKLVAWDVVIQEDGEISIIEGNASSDVTILQSEKGLRFDRLGEFMLKNDCIF